MVRISITLLITMAFIVGCQKSSGGGEGGTLRSEFTTDCGTLMNGSVRNPISSGEGATVEVTGVAGPNAVSINGNQIIKLRGLRNNIDAGREQRARDILGGFSGTAVLFTDNCSGNIGSGQSATVGQLYRPNGVSFSERLLKQDAASVQTSGSCGESQLAGCYQALLDQNGSVNPTPTQSPIGNVVSGFIWEPELESDGNVGVFLNPAGAQVVVNNDPFTDVGPSNGRGTTARSNKPGCSFGNDVQVQVFDRNGAPVAFPNGETTLVIADGCERVEL